MSDQSVLTNWEKRYRQAAEKIELQEAALDTLSVSLNEERAENLRLRNILARIKAQI